MGNAMCCAGSEDLTATTSKKGTVTKNDAAKTEGDTCGNDKAGACATGAAKDADKDKDKTTTGGDPKDKAGQ